MTSFRLQRLDHVSLNVSDRPRSLVWYRETLGLEPRNEPKQDDWPLFMGEWGCCIALFQAEPGTAEARGPESVGLRHVALMVGRTDLERARAHFSDRGLVFRVEDHGNAHSVYVTDPDGNVIELTTYEV